jgi:hypothetical protein
LVKNPQLKWALLKYGEGYGLDSFGSEEGPVIRYFANGNKTSNFIRDWQFLQQMNHCQLLKDSIQLG